MQKTVYKGVHYQINTLFQAAYLDAEQHIKA